MHWNLARQELDEPGPGHVMKVRYTSLQTDTGVAEELHPDLPTDLEGMPVVVGGLHSQVPVVAVVLKALRPTARVAYLMTDGGALPLALSDVVDQLVMAGLLDVTITAGHAFGGDLESVTVASGLALARHVARADVAIVAMGPGVVGTGSALGTTALEVASHLDAAAALGGRPIAIARMSVGDDRDRHRGVSHHTRTALDVTRSSVLVPMPVADAYDHDRHEVRVVDPPDVPHLLADAGLVVTTMGRGPEADRVFFDAAGSAGALAIELLGPEP